MQMQITQQNHTLKIRLNEFISPFAKRDIILRESEHFYFISGGVHQIPHQITIDIGDRYDFLLTDTNIKVYNAIPLDVFYIGLTKKGIACVAWTIKAMHFNCGDQLMQAMKSQLFDIPYEVYDRYMECRPMIAKLFELYTQNEGNVMMLDM